jgi:hypothetical protein
MTYLTNEERNMNTNINTITINGVDYVRADSVQPVTTGTRAVIVVDRGWVFAGDVTRNDGRIKLSRAVWVFRWESIGFDGVIANPKNTKVTIKPMPQGVDIPEGAEIFCVPVADGWGL